MHPKIDERAVLEAIGALCLASVPLLILLFCLIKGCTAGPDPYGTEPPSVIRERAGR